MRGINPNEKFKNLGKVTVPFGGRTEQESFHPGIDLANEEGTPIHAPVDGVVVKNDGGHESGENNFGNTLEIKDAEGNVHQFHHLQGSGLEPGQTVKKGQPVATLGKSGATYSPSGGDPSNLDYRIVSAYGKYINPTSFAGRL
jgi:murein DD-endopeptidase MepM/ murein hydrolase activator NlpD